MKKESYPELAKRYGISIDRVKKLKGDGVDVHDEQEVRERISKQRHRINPDAEIAASDISDDDKQTLASLKNLLLTTRDLETAKIVKEKALAFKGLLAAEKEEGLVISIREVEERETKIGSAVKAAFDKMGNDLPGSCAGLDEVGILNAYEKLKMECLTMLADMNSEFWRERK